MAWLTLTRGMGRCVLLNVPQELSLEPARAVFECSACHRVGPETMFERGADGVLICPPCEEPATLSGSLT